MMKEMVMNRFQLMAAIEKRIDNCRMELMELRLMSPPKPNAKDYAFGYGYMSAWLAEMALKHPAVMQDLLKYPEFVKASESPENAG